jgi:hypothetical protein
MSASSGRTLSRKEVLPLRSGGCASEPGTKVCLDIRDVGAGCILAILAHFIFYSLLIYKHGQVESCWLYPGTHVYIQGKCVKLAPLLDIARAKMGPTLRHGCRMHSCDFGIFDNLQHGQAELYVFLASLGRHVYVEGSVQERSSKWMINIFMQTKLLNYLLKCTINNSSSAQITTVLVKIVETLAYFGAPATPILPYFTPANQCIKLPWQVHLRHQITLACVHSKHEHTQTQNSHPFKQHLIAYMHLRRRHKRPSSHPNDNAKVFRRQQHVGRILDLAAIKCDALLLKHCLLLLHLRRLGTLQADITDTNRIQLVLFGTQNRTLGPRLTATHRTIIPEMRCAEAQVMPPSILNTQGCLPRSQCTHACPCTNARPTWTRSRRPLAGTQRRRPCAPISR